MRPNSMPGSRRAVGGWGGQTLRFYDAIKKLTLDLAATSFLGVPLGAEADRINQAFVDEVQASVAPIRMPLPGTQMRKGVKARAYLVDLFEREIPGAARARRRRRISSRNSAARPTTTAQPLSARRSPTT